MLPCRAGGGRGSGGRHAPRLCRSIRSYAGSMGEEMRQQFWRGERILPDGADPALFRTPARRLGKGIGKRHSAGRDATGGAQRASLAKIAL